MTAFGVTIRTEQLQLLTVGGEIDDVGIDLLTARADRLLAEGCRMLAVDLSSVSTCDVRLLGLLAALGDELDRRGGHLRLVGLGRSVLDVLHDARLPEVLAVYRASSARTSAPALAEPAVGP